MRELTGPDCRAGQAGWGSVCWPNSLVKLFSYPRLLRPLVAVGGRSALAPQVGRPPLVSWSAQGTWQTEEARCDLGTLETLPNCGPFRSGLRNNCPSFCFSPTLCFPTKNNSFYGIPQNKNSVVFLAYFYLLIDRCFCGLLCHFTD